MAGNSGTSDFENEVYTGTMVQGKRQKINYKIKKIRDVEESGWIKVPNMHEAIIPQKLFDTVQEVLKLDTCASKGQQTVNLFQVWFGAGAADRIWCGALYQKWKEVCLSALHHKS